jgi:hypothetical protein
MVNPWGRERISAEQAVLLALSVDPAPVSAIADKAGISETEARTALERLTKESVAIPEDDCFELTGPLSWFGDFAAAIAHYAGRNFLVSVAGEIGSHLFLCDVRIKGGRKAGDPLNETASVFACGRTARDVIQSAAEAGPTCEDCSSASRH